VSTLFSALNETELRDYCHHNIDAFESWVRRLIDELFRIKYGSDYFDHHFSDDLPLVKKEIRQRIEQRMSDNPTRFPRKIDAILLEDVVYFLCRGDLYAEHFKNILEPFFSGRGEVRKVLERLIPIRNKLSHGNSISYHDAEQCVCYTNDFISVFKDYYNKLGKSREYNVPTFIRVKDCFGNDVIVDSTNHYKIWFQFPLGPKVQLRSGDKYKLWVEIDPSFDSTLYEISWGVMYYRNDIIKKGIGKIIEFAVENKHVSYSPTITVVLTTSKEWHRHGTYDDIIEIHLDEVLPPIEETY
jgi:hypothetical protein